MRLCGRESGSAVPCKRFFLRFLNATVVKSSRNPGWRRKDIAGGEGQGERRERGGGRRGSKSLSLLLESLHSILVRRCVSGHCFRMRDQWRATIIKSLGLLVGWDVSLFPLAFHSIPDGVVNCT